MTVFLRVSAVLLSCLGLWLLPSVGQSQEAVQEQVLANFFPYREGFPQMGDIRPGLTIDSTNAQIASSVLPPEILKYLAAGDFSITVQETTDLRLGQAFIDATLKHHTGVVVGEEELQHYVAGRPFPVLDADDPQAGLKAAWNLRYRDQGDNAQMWARQDIVNSSGAVERSQTFSFLYMYGMHRSDPDKNISEWERQGVYSKQYTMMLSPSDMEGTQILSVIYDKDVIPNDQWAYDPQTRRTRKIVYNPYISPERGVLLIEDRSGFYGYTHAYDWKYLGEKTVLTPGPIRAAEPTWGGKGNWYLVDPWELRRAVVVEATPKTSHPMYSRRVLYIDLQSSMPLYALVYDHDGNHKRTFLLVAWHPDFDRWDNDEWFTQTAAQASIDYQLEMGSTYEVTKILYNRALPASRFSVMALMLQGK